MTFAELLRWLQVSENRAALGEKSGLGEESAIALPQDKAEPTPGNLSTLTVLTAMWHTDQDGARLMAGEKCI